MSNIDKITINRIYKCSNKNCSTIIRYIQKINEDFKKRCPFCHKNSLLIESANVDINTFVDMHKPKTIGSLGEKNYEKAIKEGKDVGHKKKRPPFWRKNKKINFDILKNPQGYVDTGHI